MPSQVLSIQDEYTAFCFNEACACILMHLMNDEKPHYIETGGGIEEKPKEYASMEEFYKDIGVEG